MVAFNAGLLVYCLIVFSEKNYLYFPVNPERENAVRDACENLLRINYFWLANSLNILLFGLYYTFTHRLNGAIVSGIGLALLFAGYFAFKNPKLENYYEIFRYQSVPEELVAQPARQAGTSIGPLLIEEMRKVDDPLRQRHAIRALGAIRYTAVIDTLNFLLNDWNTRNDIRFEAYFALKQMKNSKSDSYLRVFREAHHPVKDAALLKSINRADY